MKAMLVAVCALGSASGAMAHAPPQSQTTPPAHGTDIAAPLDGCEPIEVGPVYDMRVESSKPVDCVQFTTSGQTLPTRIGAIVAGLPEGARRDVHLLRLGVDGKTNVADQDIGDTGFRALYARADAPSRWLLMVAADTDRAGDAYQLQVTMSPDVDRYEPNEAPKTATVLQGNQHIEANLDSAEDVDTYLVVTPERQQSTVVRLDATEDVAAQVWKEDRWVELPRNKGLKVNASAGDALALKVQALRSPIPRPVSYSLHVADPNARAVIVRAGSSEKITHLAPGSNGWPMPGGANAARFLDVTAAVFASDDKTPATAGERVTLIAYDIDAGTNKRVELAKVTGYTDAKGQFTATLPIGECRGTGVRGPERFHRPSNRPEYWDITYVPAAAVVAIAGENDNARASAFQHVCKELYRGYRP